MKIDIVLLTWNDPDVTLACLQQIESWRPPQSRVWIVDNGSTLPFPKATTAATVIRNEKNLGFSGGVNSAFRQLIPLHSDAVLLLNTDVVLSPKDANALLECFEAHPEIAAMSPLLCETDGDTKTRYAGSRNIGRHVATRCKAYARSTADHPDVLPAAYLSGTAFLCRTTVFKTIGFLDERFFFSGEIADLCHRIALSNQTCAVCTTSTIVHDLAQKEHQRSSVHVYYALRNRFLFVRIHESFGARLALTAFWLAVGMAMVVQSTLKGNGIKSRSALKAIRDGVSGQYGDRNANLPL